MLVGPRRANRAIGWSVTIESATDWQGAARYPRALGRAGRFTDSNGDMSDLLEGVRSSFPRNDRALARALARGGQVAYAVFDSVRETPRPEHAASEDHGARAALGEAATHPAALGQDPRRCQRVCLRLPDLRPFGDRAQADARARRRPAAAVPSPRRRDAARSNRWRSPGGAARRSACASTATARRR